MHGRRSLCQWFMPSWFAETLYDCVFRSLGPRDLLWEPNAGTGACLAAVPRNVPAFGTEIDRRYAGIAARRSGRRVLVGDCLSTRLPRGITAVFGNPPFDSVLVESLLDRCALFLPQGRHCALLLPAYFFQTSTTVVRLNKQWTIRQQMVPRDLFRYPIQMQAPLVFGVFTRDTVPHLVGFCGYHEVGETRDLPEHTQRLLADSHKGPRSAWREVFRSSLLALGGEAPLSAIYANVAGRLPTGNPHWKAQLRKVGRRDFKRTAPGVYALPRAA